MPTLRRTAPSGAKANKKENSSSQTRAASQSSTLSDHRPGTLAQMKVVEAMSEGPRAQKTAQLQALMPNNPPVQKAADEEEVQMKAKPVQKVADEEEVQMKVAPVQKKENNTGLPDVLKSGVENLSGVSMNDVKVHTNSDQPAQMQAHAFAQGTDIHVASGQEKHLPHEAWHVVQQKQGRVKPTNQLKDEVPVNDDKGLEHEADVMGAKALRAADDNREVSQFKQVNSSTPDTIQKAVKAGKIGSSDDGKDMKGIPGDGINIEGIDDLFEEESIAAADSKKSGLSFATESKDKKKQANDDGSVTIDESSSKSEIALETVVNKLTQIDDTSIKTATQYMARMGAFGESAAKKTIESSDGSTMEADGKASASAGAKGEAMSATVLDAVDGLTQILKISGSLGFEGTLEGTLSAATKVGGLELKAKLASKMTTFFGIKAEVGGKFNYGWKGASVEGKAEVSAGVEGSAETKVSLSAGDIGLDAGIKVEGFAGAKAGMEGKFGVGVEGIEAKGKLEALAGVSGKVSGDTSLTVNGKVLFKVSGELEGALGAGGNVEGEFSFKNGKLVIKGKLALVLGIGGGVGLGVEIDIKEIGIAVKNAIKNALTWWGKEKKPEEIIAHDDRTPDPDESTQATVKRNIMNELKPHVEAYSNKKGKLVTTGGWFYGWKAKELVKQDKLQKMIDSKIKKSEDKDIKAAVTSTSKYVDLAIEDALRAGIDNDMLTYVEVNNKNIVKLNLIDVDTFRKKKGK